MIQATVVQPNDNIGYEEPFMGTVNQSVPNENADDLTAQFKGLFDAFADALPNGSQEQKTSKTFFKKFSDYIGSNNFKKDLKEKSEKYGVPAKQLAKNFFLKILGIIGDILGIVVNTVCSIVDTAVSLLSTLLHGAVDVIGKVANGIVGIVTLNQTTIA